MSTHSLNPTLATQHPAPLPVDVISQSNVLISHQLAPTHAHDLSITKFACDSGQIIIVGDAERPIVAHILER